MWLQPGSWLSGPWWLVAAMRPTVSLWWWFAHGWNISKRTRILRTREHCRLGWLVVVCVGVRGGTLLGCRSTSSAPWWVLVVGSSWNIIEVRGLWVVGGVGGLLFVNYIVDVSIFERRAFYDRYLVTGSLLWGSGGGCGGGCVVCIFDDYLCCVAYKLLRAHGGCLGIRS